VVAVSIGFFAKFSRWDAGWSYGPRYLAPVIPMIVLPMAALFEWASRTGRRALHAAFWGVMAASLLVQVFSLPSSVYRYYYLEMYNVAARRSPWWFGSHPTLAPYALLQNIDAIPKLMSFRPNRPPGRMSPEDRYLAEQWESHHLMMFDLWPVKALRAGAPRPLVGGIAVSLLLAAAWSFHGLMRATGANSLADVRHDRGGERRGAEKADRHGQA
jgi:hypothetical protein